MNDVHLLGPRKILMTADPVGGVWMYSLELCRALAGHDVQVALATMGGRLSDEQRAEAERLTNAELFESDYKLEWMDDSAGDCARAGEWLLAIEREARPDLVHLNGFAHGSLRWNSPLIIVGHSCVLSWWRAVKKQPAPSQFHWYHGAASRGLRAADLVVAPSQAMLSSLEQFYGPLRASEVIYNGRDPDEFFPRPKEEFILCAGRLWDEAKNTRAVAAIAERLPWPVIAAGVVTDPRGQSAHFKSIGHAGQLSCAELASLQGRASIFVSPARYEPFGLCALEAGLCGCALVLGDIPSLREIWEDAALFVHPEDVDELQRAIELLIHDPALRYEMSSRARDRAVQFTPQRMADAYMLAYQDVMMERVPGALDLNGILA